jgi:predicted ArsR family transcriptional regulator
MTPPQSSLENTLCSRVRLRMLKVLIEFHTLTPAQIATEVGVNYIVACAHLDALERGDILTHSNFGQRIRYYRFKESARAKAVKRLIEAWNLHSDCDDDQTAKPQTA